MVPGNVSLVIRTPASGFRSRRIADDAGDHAGGRRGERERGSHHATRLAQFHVRIHALLHRLDVFGDDRDCRIGDRLAAKHEAHDTIFADIGKPKSPVGVRRDAEARSSGGMVLVRTNRGIQALTDRLEEPPEFIARTPGN